MHQKSLANGATGGFLLALLTAIIASVGSGLSYQSAEILGMLVMFGGALLTQGYALWKTPDAMQGDFQHRLKAVLAATISMCLVYGLVLYVHYALLDPDYLQEFFTHYREEILAAAGSPEDRAARLEFIEQNRDFMLDPFKQAMLMAGTLLGISGLGALLVSALLKRTAQ
ncbi:MAG: DUF4199 family protein [Gammaproteobacteria bacterium]|nr:DUF4199 family protein [Gammaproteobacteria bacterium]